MSSSPTRFRRRPSLESLEGRSLLSQGLTPMTPLPGGVAVGPAEVRPAAEAPAVIDGPAAGQQALSAQASSAPGGYSQILSPIVPMTLSDGRTSGATIWAKDAAGQLVRNDPVAVALRTWPSLTYYFHLADGSRVGTLAYQAEFVRTDGHTIVAASGSLRYSPGSAISVPLPAAVGQYTLKVRLVATGLVEETRQHRVYVLLKDPLETATPRSAIDGRIPVIRSERVIGYATWWATGQTTAAGVVAALNQSIYRNRLGWKYGDGGRASTPYDFLRLGADGGVAVREGDCHDFAEVLSFLSALHGIDVGMGFYNGLFLVRGDRPPLSGVDPANQNPGVLNLATGQRDAWHNGNHRLVVFGGRYFDPLFGFSGDYNPADAGSLARSYGENLLGYIGEGVPDTPGAYWLMKNGGRVGIYFDGADKRYRISA